MKKRKQLLFLLLITLVAGINLSAQNNTITVSGNVTDDTGDVLIGVTIAQEGSSKTLALTDIEGNFSVNVPSSSTLLFSYLGLTTQSVPVNGKTILNVILKKDDKILDELVVVGYGIQKRRDVTGAVMSIKPSDLQDMPQVNVVQSLQGKMPGVNIVNTGSAAEGGSKLRIRAKNSISADSEPLIILDGIQFGGFLSEISPNDIESIEVLKDASSAAIYGAKAAGGVVLITTKKGTAGKPRVSFDTNVGISHLINMPDMMNASQYYHFKKQRKGYVGTFEEANYLAGIDTDWVDHTLQTGVSREYNLSVSGGTENTTYFVSGNLSLIDGIAKNDNFDRFTLRINLETKINPWLKFGTNTNLGYYNRPGVKADIAAALKFNPLATPYDENGLLDYEPDKLEPTKNNPLENLNYEKEDVARSVTTNNFIHIDFPFLKGLSLRTIGGYNFRSRLIEQYKSSINTLEGQKMGGSASVNNQYKEDWSIENILNYTKQLGRHSINLTGVYTAQEYVQKFHDLNGVGFPNDSRT